MVFKRKYNPNRNAVEKKVSCACGGNARLSSRKNYPFGEKSTSITSWFYKCPSCKKVTFSSQNSTDQRPRGR
ncbi:MAG: hypothetical protein ABH864_03465 [archaeon]